MNKATEIGNLPPSSNNNEESNELVDKIINEIKTNEENDNNGMEMNIQEQQMPPSQPMYSPELPPQMMNQPQNDNMMFNNMDNEQLAYMSSDNGMDLMNKLKLTAIVLAILFVMLLPLLDKYLSKLIPALYVNNNSLSMMGVLLKSVVGAVLFYLATMLN